MADDKRSAAEKEQAKAAERLRAKRNRRRKAEAERTDQRGQGGHKKR